MKYYSTVKNIILKHGDIENGLSVEVSLERAKEHGYAYAYSRIPQFTFYDSHGFGDSELADLSEYLKMNAHLIWEYAGRSNRESLYEHFCRLSASEMTELAQQAESNAEEKFYQEAIDLKIRFPFQDE